MRRLKVPLIAVAVAAVALAAYLGARHYALAPYSGRGTVPGPPPRMMALPAGSPTPGRDGDILKPARELIFETGKAPINVVFCEKSGLAYVACTGRRDGAPPEDRRPAELCVVDAKSGRTIRRIPYANLSWVELSPDQRHLRLHAWEQKNDQSVDAVYETEDLSRQLTLNKHPLANGAAMGCGGSSYLVYARLGTRLQTKLLRVSPDGERSVNLDRDVGAMCVGPDCSHFYLALCGLVDREAEIDEYPLTSLLVLDPNTLRVLQTVTLPDRECALDFVPWVGGRCLVVFSDEGAIDIVPIGTDGLLTPPREPSGIRAKKTAWPPVVDEKRSLACCLGLWGDDAFISVVDLAARRLVGWVHISDEDWDVPHLSLSPTTDELWVAITSMDRIPIYRIEDVIKRARESGATEPPTDGPAAAARRSPGGAAGNATP